MPSHDRAQQNGKHKGRHREPRKDLVVYGKDGKIKHTMREGDKLEERRKLGPEEGKRMRVLKGSHKGLFCTVITIHEKVPSSKF